MRLIGLVLAVAALVPSGARANHPVSESCSPITCVTAHAQVETGCGADGRDPSSCLGTVQYIIAFDGPVPIESMDYSIDISCSTTCAGSGETTGTCGWAPPEVRPIGETGCTISEIRSVTFAAPPQQGCASYQVTAKIDVATVLDPLASAHHEATDAVEVCS